MIELTPEQEAYLPVFREMYLDAACGGHRADLAELTSAFAAAYAEIGQPAPEVRLFPSEDAALNALYEFKLAHGVTDTPRYDGNYLWGSQDLYWIAWGKFAEHIGVKLTEEQSRRLEIMRRIGWQCEWWWPFEGIVFASERPIVVKWDDRNLLHCENGPAVEYEDGYALYSWHGVSVPKAWIMDKASITPEVALTWENIEQRRCAMEILGWESVLQQLGDKVCVVNDSGDPEIGVLLEAELPGFGEEGEAGKARFLRVQCATKRFFSLSVPREMQTAMQASAWSYGLDEHEYMKPVRT